jgi:RNA polymerase sigma-70 factor (ECF subfamily)
MADADIGMAGFEEVAQNGLLQDLNPVSSERDRAAERGCFEDLLAAMEKPILRLCYRLIGNAADTQDAAQEVFLKAWRNRHRVPADRNPSPWLYQIAVNTCRDYFRRRRAAGEVRDGAWDGASPEAEASRSEQQRMVMEGLAQLAERERMAVVLRDLEGMETTEVGALMGVSEATVRSQASQGRAKLKAWIEARVKR